MKNLILITILALAATFAAPAAQGASKDLAQEKAAKPLLNEFVSVEGTYILLGDLFENTGRKADTKIARAPRPGRRVTLDARWLYRIAKAYRLDWKPDTIDTQTIVERAAQVISRSEIEDAVMAAFGDYGLEGNQQVILSNRGMQIYVPHDQLPTIAVSNLNYDRRSHRFTAVLTVPANARNAQRVRVNGKIHRIVEVPMLSRRVLKDEIIREDDVEWIKMRADKVMRNTITELDQIVGMSPRTSMRAGRPVRLGDVSAPVVVPRRSIVTVELNTPFMRLTAQGKAMENGALGEVIRISNLKSKTVIEAVVTGPAKARIVGANQLAMN